MPNSPKGPFVKSDSIGRPAAPAKLHMVDARSIRPREKSKLLTPESHWEHYSHTLTDRPSKLFGHWDRWLASDKFYMIPDHLWRHVASLHSSRSLAHSVAH